MAYRNAADVLPAELIEEIRKYMDGGLLYIPSGTDKREWGLLSGAKEKYDRRNREIRERFRGRESVEELARQYFLSPESIRKIVYGGCPEEETERKKETS